MTKLEQMNNYEKNLPTYNDIINMALFLPKEHQLDAPSLEYLCNQYCDSLSDFLQNDLANSIQAENALGFRKVALLALSNLPLRNREVVELVCFHGYDIAEAAMIVDCAVGVVEIRLSYARNKINEAFQN